jgi:hypothetical protein
MADLSGQDQTEAKAPGTRSASKKSTSAERELVKPSRRARKTKRAANKLTNLRQHSSPVVMSAEQLPRRTLEQSLRVAKALRDTLAGGPATWQDIASAMKIGTRPQNKYYLWSAQAYNIVQRDDENKYSISEIGRKILAPTSPNEDKEAVVQAVLSPVILSRFFTDYNGSPFPAEEHIGNILERKYGVPRERIDEAKALIRENGIYAGILIAQQDGTMTVRLDPKSTGIPQTTANILEEKTDTVGVEEIATTESATEFDRVCFVITPIGEDDSEQRRHANMMLKSVIEPVVSELGLTARRADQIDRAGIITQQIFEYIAKSRICVADLSFSNANAFYELGVRHMCKLPTVQMIRKGDKIPFDVSQGRTIKIDMSDVYTVMDSVESAKKELKQYMRQALSTDYKGDDNPVNTYLPGVEVRIPK